MKHLIVFVSLYSATLIFSIESFSQKDNVKKYSIEQATSDRAQLHTIAFDGLAFITGSFGADCFFPPGKVADFFGFQYMRDNDQNKLGHNTDFLTRIATNTISILNKDQMDKLIALAKEQENIYNVFANKRMILIAAFDDHLNNNNRKLNKDAVAKFCGDLYVLDGELSYRRAEIMGDIIRSLNSEQKEALNKLDFSNSATWPEMPERLDKQSMSHRAHVGVMTYASELFSWYKGSLTADIYFCPERHGTYFGGFYLKDYPAMGNKGYSISTALTGDAGKSFLEILNEDQLMQITNLTSLHKKNMDEIVRLRTVISTNLRKFIDGEKPSKTELINWVRQYGENDGSLSYYYACAFSNVNKNLSGEQRAKLKALRNLDVLPKGAYLYSDPIPNPVNIDYSFLLEK